MTHATGALVGGAPVRVGLAGLGSMGRNHLRILGSRPDVQLVAIADPVVEVLRAAAERSGAQPFAEPDAMVAEAELDALVIAAPTMAHVPLALAAIERRVAVLVEKPLAATVDEGMRIVAAARQSGVPVQVGHVERFNPAVLELGRLLADGWLSSVYAIASRRAGPFPARIRDVGVTVDLATHDVDILSWIAGERPSRVYAETAQRIHADLPVTDGAAEHTLALPMFPGLTDAEQDLVIEAVRAAVERHLGPGAAGAGAGTGVTSPTAAAGSAAR